MSRAIEVEGISKRYELGHQKAGSLRESFKSKFKKSSSKEEREFWALKDVSFQVNEGEAVGIIGRNGAGKSTLLKILSRITYPTSGNIKVFGRVSSLLEVGTGFHPELSGRENIYLNGTILGMRRSEVKAKFEEIVEFSGVSKFIDTPIKHYSSGMKVRLAFAVAAHLEPEILIIDEVLAVGDAEFQKKCLGKMEEVAGQGRTVLFVSHNMLQVQALCRKGILLDNGKISFEGTANAAVNYYLKGLGKTGDDIDVTTMARAGTKHHAMTIKSVSLQDGNADGTFNEGETVTLLIKFELQEPIENLIIGFSLSTSTNGDLVECRSTASFPNLSLNTGQFSVRVTSKLSLKAGSYMLNLGARSLKGHLEYIPSVTVLNIVPNQPTETAEWSNSSAGVLITSSHWKLLE